MKIEGRKEILTATNKTGTYMLIQDSRLVFLQLNVLKTSSVHWTAFLLVPRELTACSEIQHKLGECR